MKVAITGTRKFADYDILCKALDSLAPSEIITGGAKGADTLAEQYADNNHIPKTIFLPKFKTNRDTPYHPGWYHERNRSIVNYADIVVAFWDGKSAGTKSTLEYADKKHKRVILVHV